MVLLRVAALVHIHAAPAPTRHHRNLSVERTGYQPIRLSELLTTDLRPVFSPGVGMGDVAQADDRVAGPDPAAPLGEGDRIVAGGDMSEAITATLRHDSAERRRATYQDVLDAPPHRVAEVVDGVLHTNPRPAMRHAHASSSLGTKIGGPFHHDAGGPGGWLFSVNYFCRSCCLI